MFDSWNLTKKNKTKKTDNPISEEEKISIDQLKEYLQKSNDVVFKEIILNKNEILNLCYIEGLVKIELIDETIVKPIVNEKLRKENVKIKDVYQRIEDGLIYHISYTKEEKLNACIDKILNGFVCVIGNQEKKAFLFETKGFEKRSIQEPTDENVIKGSKDSFIEALRVNTGLIRRKIKSKNLVIKEMEVGEVSKTNIAIIYLESIVDKKILIELEEKIKNIKVDNILSPSNFEEQIIDKRLSVFPQAYYTERPDKLCSNINEGKIGIVIDGLPTAYVVPAVFSMFLQAPEDYAYNYFMGSFLRILRYFCMIVSLIAPAFYIAVMTFHHEMIPSELALSIMQSKDGVPFTTFLETLFMILAFEVLTEAGMRLPKVIGQTASVVGGLIVGQAAVEAKIISPASLIVVAAAAISGFVIPNQDFSNALRIWRILLFLLSTIGGLFGLSIGVILLLYHLCSIKSFGIPYMIPYASNDGQNLLKDTFIRPPNFKGEDMGK